MEVLKFLEQIPLPILVVALVILVAITVVMAYQYAKMRGMDGHPGGCIPVDPESRACLQ